MWYLLEDVLEQPLVMKALIAWGWLSVWIMIFSAYTSISDMVQTAMAASA